MENRYSRNRNLPSGRLTIMFTDVVGSTAWSKRLSKSEYYEAMQQHKARLRIMIEAQGTIVKLMGDAFFAVFEQVNSALQCAAEIQDMMKSMPLWWSQEKHPGEMLEIRIGLYRALSEIESTIDGDYHDREINLAARICPLAKGGQILASESVYKTENRTARSRWKEWEDRRIKDFDDPESLGEYLWDGESRGEPGSRFFPDWYPGEHNAYIPRPIKEREILAYFKEAALLQRFDSHISDNEKLPYFNESAYRAPVRIVTLHGYGGMGKTRLAVQCAVQCAALFPDGVKFAQLENSNPSPVSVAEAIGKAFGLCGSAALPNLLPSALKSRTALVVLDNYETVACPEVSAFLTQLLKAAQNLRFLVTGRKTTQLSGLEQRIDIGAMSAQEAEDLFTTRARMREPAWTPDSDAEKRAVAEILELTERIPLSIELCAAQMFRKKSAVRIAESLRNAPLPALPKDYTAVHAERQESLWKSLEHSYTLLEPTEQTMLAFLGLFADSFSVNTVQGICNLNGSERGFADWAARLGWRTEARRPLPDTEDILERLLEASLVAAMSPPDAQHSASAGRRYRLLLPTRAYALEKLAGRPEARSIRKSYRAFYLQFMQANGGAENLSDRVKNSLLDQEWRNALVVAEAAAAERDWGAVCTVSELLGPYLLQAGYWSERLQLNWLALNSAQKLDRHQEGVALNNLGVIHKTMGLWTEAEDCYLQDLAICREQSDREGEKSTLNNLGSLYFVQGESVKAEQTYRDCLAHCRELKDRSTEGIVRNNLGLVYMELRDWASAEECLTASLAIRRQTRDKLGEAKTLNNMANLYVEQRREPEAEASFQTSLSIFVELRNRLGEAEVSRDLGIYRRKAEQFLEADTYFKRSLELFRELADRINEGKTMEQIALLRKAQGDITSALNAARDAVSLLESTQDSVAAAKAKDTLASLE